MSAVSSYLSELMISMS